MRLRAASPQCQWIQRILFGFVTYVRKYERDRGGSPLCRSGHNHVVPVLISDLLAVSALGLRSLTSHCSRVDHPITWVSTTELPDPLPFLGGGELVMTTGMLERSEEDWRDIVRRLADLPVAGLCFGVGLVHQAVPDVVVSAAEDSGLALVSSPVEVPFVQISRWVADRLFAEQYDAVQAMVTVQDRLVRGLLSHNGLRGLLRRLHRELRCGAVAVLDADGRLVDRYPARGGYEPAPPDDSTARLMTAIGRDEVVFRAFVEMIGCLASAPEVMARPEIQERLSRVEPAPRGPVPGPDRAQVLQLLSA